MCKCTPGIRTPFCGKGDCHYPHEKKPEGARKNEDNPMKKITENLIPMPEKFETTKQLEKTLYKIEEMGFSLRDYVRLSDAEYETITGRKANEFHSTNLEFQGASGKIRVVSHWQYSVLLHAGKIKNEGEE